MRGRDSIPTHLSSVLRCHHSEQRRLLTKNYEFILRVKNTVILIKNLFLINISTSEIKV